MEKLVIEIPQNDGITVKERIIRFFSTKVDRETAEMFYDHAIEVAQSSTNSTDVFDHCITVICDSLGLSANQLAKEIANHTIKN